MYQLFLVLRRQHFWRFCRAWTKWAPPVLRHFLLHFDVHCIYSATVTGIQKERCGATVWQKNYTYKWQTVINYGSLVNIADT